MYEMHIGSVAIVNQQNEIVESCSLSDLEVLNVADVHLLSKNIMDFFNLKRLLATCSKEDDVNYAVKMVSSIDIDVGEQQGSRVGSRCQEAYRYFNSH